MKITPKCNENYPIGILTKAKFALDNQADLSDYKMRTSIIAVLSLLLCSCIAEARYVRVLLAGDSTCADMKNVSSSSYRGWGQVFQFFYDSRHVTVINFAKGGASTKTFREHGCWDALASEMKKGDIVLIQFGHNDENVKDGRGTTPDEYKQNLIGYVQEVRAAGADPVLMTPILRRRYDAQGKAMRGGGGNFNHLKYSPKVFEVAHELKVPLIDGEQISEQWLDSMTPDTAKDYFVWFRSGAYLKYPDGKTDDVHLNQKGAYEIASRFSEELCSVKPILKRHHIQVDYNVVEEALGSIRIFSEK